MLNVIFQKVLRGGVSVFENLISVASNGDTPCFFQERKFTILQDAYILKYKHKDLNNKQYLYLTAILQHILKKYNWNNKAGWTKLSADTIPLPVYNKGQIAYDYMESYIRELEQERIRELEAYLIATGLSDYKLTEKERGGVDDLLENKINFKEYKIGELFEKLILKFKGNNFSKNKDLSTIPNKIFNLPLVNAKHGNNGIMYYGKEEDWEYAENTIDVVNDGAIATGNIYPQPQKTGVLYNAYLIKPKFDLLNSEILMYFSTAIQKSIKYKYGYDKKASWERVKNDIITLPIKDDEPDFDYMELFIKAIEKIVIKNVVQWKDKVIETHKEMVNRQQ